MSCAQTKLIEKTLTPRELRAFCNHMLECPDCGVLLQRITRTYRVLREEEIAPLSPARRVALLSRIETLAPFESRISRSGLSIAFAGVLVALCLIFWPVPSLVISPHPIRTEGALGTPPALAWEPILTPLDPFRMNLELSPLSSPESALAPATRRRIAATAVIVQPIVEQPPVRKIVRELLARADELRRSGKDSAAAALYLEVAAHTNGGEYAEEALLRAAQIFADQKLEDDAFTVLRTAASRFPNGMLAPERAVLAAYLHLTRGEANAAADALERIGDRRDLAMLRARVEVAESLLASSPERARKLVVPVLTSDAPEDLLERAQMIDRSSRGNR